ncbi:unnamed protein product [Eretmochelys imbricata]
MGRSGRGNGKAEGGSGAGLRGREPAVLPVRRGSLGPPRARPRPRLQCRLEAHGPGDNASRFLFTMSPESENRCSHGTVVASITRYLRARWAKDSYVP